VSKVPERECQKVMQASAPFRFECTSSGKIQAESNLTVSMTDQVRILFKPLLDEDFNVHHFIFLVFTKSANLAVRFSAPIFSPPKILGD
jgi:hypothetical protein